MCNLNTETSSQKSPIGRGRAIFKSQELPPGEPIRNGRISRSAGQLPKYACSQLGFSTAPGHGIASVNPSRISQALGFPQQKSHIKTNISDRTSPPLTTEIIQMRPKNGNYLNGNIPGTTCEFPANQAQVQHYPTEEMPYHQLISQLSQLNLSMATGCLPGQHNSGARNFPHVLQTQPVPQHNMTGQPSAELRSLSPKQGNCSPAYPQYQTSAISSSGLPSVSDLAYQPVTNPTVQSTFDEDNDSDDCSDEETTLSHPNKYPIEIEYHDNKYCCYKRQPTRSGTKVKQRHVTVYDPMTLQPTSDLQITKYYQKDIVRICRCGRYTEMDGALTHGRSNDCDGYEIHYNQKCRWKAYDDYKTGKRVLIRLCKCYKPSLG